MLGLGLRRAGCLAESEGQGQTEDGAEDMMLEVTEYGGEGINGDVSRHSRLSFVRRVSIIDY